MGNCWGFFPALSTARCVSHSIFSPNILLNLTLLASSASLLHHPSFGEELLSSIASLGLATPTGKAQPILSPTCNPETIHALLLAAKSGDVDALATLQGLSGATTMPAKPQPALGGHLPLPTSLSMPSSTSASDAAILASGKMDVEALERAANLGDVIDQLERGDVVHMREKYGPQPGRPHNPLWAKIKVTICRRERLHLQLMSPKEFNGNKQRFLDFFASAPSRRPSKRTRAGKEKASEQYPPFRLLVEAIPHRDRDIAEEKAKLRYLGEDGTFSERAWADAWQGTNDWEIWRALGKERY